MAGREHNGVFPLRGKMMNVNGMSSALPSENVGEIRHLLQILKLDPNVDTTQRAWTSFPIDTS